MNDYTKQCHQCGEWYEAKRTDQMYCTQRCKNRHNNSKKRRQKQVITEKEQVLRKSINAIWHNRGILQQFSGQEILFQDLLDAGFEDGFVSGFRTAKGQRQAWFYCGDYAYQFLNKKTVRVASVN